MTFRRECHTIPYFQAAHPVIFKPQLTQKELELQGILAKLIDISTAGTLN